MPTGRLALCASTAPVLPFGACRRLPMTTSASWTSCKSWPPWRGCLPVPPRPAAARRPARRSERARASRMWSRRAKLQAEHCWCTCPASCQLLSAYKRKRQPEAEHAKHAGKTYRLRRNRLQPMPRKPVVARCVTGACLLAKPVGALHPLFISKLPILAWRPSCHA